jgi:cation:H+ antiporter
MRGWRERLRGRVRAGGRGRALKPGGFALLAGLDAAAPAGSPLSALWTFPSMIASAFLVAWGAEAAEFLMSQGLALAVLALVQTLPEFAVEAVIAWKAGKDPSMVHLAIANFTGSLRLLTGLGWPMIYAVAAFYSRKKNGTRLGRITLADDQAVEVIGLLPPLAYFVVVWAKSNLSLVDAAVLATTYVVYLAVLLKMPPREECIEEDEEIPAVSKWALSYTGGKRWAAVGALLLGGGAVIYFVAEPFLASMMALAVSFGMSQFVFIQWVAPFLSEFPEKTSAFAWARRVTRAPVALVNMVSSNINQWGILSGLLAVIYCWSHGSTEPLPFDAFQRSEILLTIVQAFLGWLFLASMSFEAYEAVGLFALWLIQFLVPPLRHAMLFVYGAWIVVEVGLVVTGRKKLLAFGAFARSWKAARRPKGA